MKKLFLICIYILITALAFSQSNLYQLSFTGFDKNQVNMHDYLGKKILVIESDAANPDRNQLMGLDSLYKANKDSLVVIAIPVTDFSYSPQDSTVRKLWRDTLKLSFVIAKISKAKKISGAAQNPLLTWLTNKDQNNHFGDDVDHTGQMYLINETGLMYANLKATIAAGNPLLTTLLRQ